MEYIDFSDIPEVSISKKSEQKAKSNNKKKSRPYIGRKTKNQI